MTKEYMTPEQIASVIKDKGYDSAEVRIRPSLFGRRLFVEAVAGHKAYKVGESPRSVEGGTDYGVVAYESAKSRLVGLAKDLQAGLRKKGIKVKPNTKLESLLKEEETSHWHVPETTCTICLIGGAFFLSSNITGNVIANLTNQTSSFIGAGLLVIGLISGSIWLRSR